MICKLVFPSHRVCPRKKDLVKWLIAHTETSNNIITKEERLSSAIHSVQLPIFADRDDATKGIKCRDCQQTFQLSLPYCNHAKKIPDDQRYLFDRNVTRICPLTLQRVTESAAYAGHAPRRANTMNDFPPRPANNQPNNNFPPRPPNNQPNNNFPPRPPNNQPNNNMWNDTPREAPDNQAENMRNFYMATLPDHLRREIDEVIKEAYELIRDKAELDRLASQEHQNLQAMDQEIENLERIISDMQGR
ncbi:hypothetical protein BT69DRAFT_1275748 [Atractiella rhizophila]|nr:hypothetical protein BT69DRAFT_1275748 [Atractiella rhizophila]